jgi:SAM-dependent methyltransferase
MSDPAPTRWSTGSRAGADDYDARWEQLAARGVDPHGEVAFVMHHAPTSVLDAGCGTGRVAIELARRGVDVVGVDLDAGLLGAAREKAPELSWHLADLTTVDLGRLFDVVVLAGNVMIFLAPGTEGAVLANLRAHLAPGGHLIAGFQVQPHRLPLARFDAAAAAAGLAPVERFAGWDRTPYADGDYAVSVLVAA